VPLLVEGWGVHYLVANLVAVLACAVANYVAGDRFVFTDSAAALSRCGRRRCRDVVRATVR
jgi:putative flippase GtrA